MSIKNKFKKKLTCLEMIGRILWNYFQNILSLIRFDRHVNKFDIIFCLLVIDEQKMTSWRHTHIYFFSNLLLNSCLNNVKLSWKFRSQKSNSLQLLPILGSKLFIIMHLNDHIFFLFSLIYYARINGNLHYLEQFTMWGNLFLCR